MSNRRRDGGGTLRYAAPELLDGFRDKQILTKKSDMYSLSMVIVEVRGFLSYLPECSLSRLAASCIQGTFLSLARLIIG